MADSWLDVSRKSTEGNATFAESTAFNRTSGSSCQVELFLISVLAGGHRVHFVEISLKALLRSNHEKNVSSEQKAIFARAITRQCKKRKPASASARIPGKFRLLFRTNSDDLLLDAWCFVAARHSWRVECL